MGEIVIDMRLRKMMDYMFREKREIITKILPTVAEAVAQYISENVQPEEWEKYVNDVEEIFGYMIRMFLK